MDSIKRVEDFGKITGGAIGISGITPPEFYTRLWIMQNATPSELRSLMEYPNGTIKATAIEGLIRGETSNKLDLFRMALEDTTTFVNFQSGCIAEPMTIGEYLGAEVLGIGRFSPPNLQSAARRLECTEQELKLLVPILHEREEKKWSYYENIGS